MSFFYAIEDGEVAEAQGSSQTPQSLAGARLCCDAFGAYEIRITENGNINEIHHEARNESAREMEHRDQWIPQIHPSGILHLALDFVHLIEFIIQIEMNLEN